MDQNVECMSGLDRCWPQTEEMSIAHAGAPESSDQIVKHMEKQATTLNAVSVSDDVASYDSTLLVGRGKAERERRTKLEGRKSFPAQAKN
jgi:hypothetical protein